MRIGATNYEFRKPSCGPSRNGCQSRIAGEGAVASISCVVCDLELHPGVLMA